MKKMEEIMLEVKNKETIKKVHSTSCRQMASIAIQKKEQGTFVNSLINSEFIPANIKRVEKSVNVNLLN